MNYDIEQVLNEAKEVIVPEVAIRYGAFIQTIVDFLIVAAAVFVMIKVIAVLSSIRLKEQAKEKLEANGLLLNEKVTYIESNSVDADLVVTTIHNFNIALNGLEQLVAFSLASFEVFGTESDELFGSAILGSPKFSSTIHATFD